MTLTSFASLPVPASVLGALLWLSLGGVAAGATYLLVVLVREWRRGQLW